MEVRQREARVKEMAERPDLSRGSVCTLKTRVAISFLS